jgi:exodeoxyribonuclease V alpha subunit
LSFEASESLSGLIERVTYHQPDSGYCVLRLKVNGLQFKAQTLQTCAPTTIEGLEKYLGSGLIKGIGPVSGVLHETK